MIQALSLDIPTPLAYFASLVAEDAGLNVLECAVAIAQDEHPDLDIQTVLADVDGLARRVGERLPADAAASHKLRVLSHFFYQELGFAGNVNNFYEPGNSYVHRVLATRRGIPISLALVFMELATQLGLRAQGVAFPGHFLIKLRLASGEVMLDPFTGRALSREQLDEFLQSFRVGAGLPDDAELPVELFLQAASPRQIIARMLRNLKEIHRAAQDLPLLLAVQQRLVVLLPDDAIERRDRGLVFEATGQWSAAAADLAHYLHHHADAQDAPLLRERLNALNALNAPREQREPPLH